MGNCIATFFSYFGAMVFKKKCDGEGYPAVIMPVPRSLSSSCGTCVKFTGSPATAKNWHSDELEQLAEIIRNQRSIEGMMRSNVLRKYMPSLLLFLLFETVALTLWIIKDNLFYH